MGGGKGIYGMLGVGAGNILFIVGFTVGYQFGLHPLTSMAVGLLGLYCGISLVIQLERLDSDR